jgi:hypothetical protein
MQTKQVDGREKNKRNGDEAEVRRESKRAEDEKGDETESLIEQ